MLTHIFLGNPPTNVKQWIKDHYGPKLDEPLCFTAEAANSTLHLDKKGSPNAISLETSMDGNTWTDYTWSDNTGPTLTLKNVGDKVYMRAKNENQTIGSSIDDCYQFVMDGKIAASGNIQTLLKADGSKTDAPAYCYGGMFQNCRSLTTAPELPATTLASNCYNGMFSLCEYLTTAPELPATTLADYCYQGMFDSCTSLTSAPELPATTLAKSCYGSMFQGCSSLTTAPSILPATTLATDCCYNMFYGCSSLTKAPGLPATTLASNCYNSMFFGCSSLTTAPELQATTLASNCYNSMFSGCTSLTAAPSILPATTLAESCYGSMFQGCTALTQAPAIKTYTPDLTAFVNMLNEFDYNTEAWSQLTSCNWPDLTLSEAESMVLNEHIFGEVGEAGVIINITCKDGNARAYFNMDNIQWVFER